MANLKLFAWSGKNKLQQKQQGMIVARDKTEAQYRLFQRGLANVKLQQHWQLTSKPKKAQLVDLFTQLSVLLNSAVPLKDSLQILWQNCAQPALYQWLGQLISDLESGLSFSQALERQGRYLNYQERQLILVGEMTGKLPLVCEQLAQHKMQTLALQRKIQKILLYPMVVLAISFILTVLLLMFIVPQFAEMYAENQAGLPTFTAILLHISAGLQDYFWQLTLLLGLLSALLRYQFSHSPSWQRQKAKLMMRLPVICRVVQFSRLIRFCHSLSLMLNAGIALTQGLQSFLPQQKSWQASPALSGDILLTEWIKETLNGVNQGYPLSASVSSVWFPMPAQQMLKIGENSGKVALMLRHIADTYQQQLDHQVDLLAQLLEPLLMLIIGGLIGAVMLGMYLPIFNMGSLIQ
ncbi:type II secretion system protein F [Actinobacillus seminis]|uniref:Type II secretion system protein n=1 Tax=Actinobacillus seminis TaxID=722 RepID=A0A263H9Q6_9PAST|nr:type II secretion system F family protein [Actinobacillus seminis]OZN24183.1 type II secretion system protein F [Actinobacillus seminis]SUU38685.1 type II secretion system protein [Actinobacillus seminis]